MLSRIFSQVYDFGMNMLSAALSWISNFFMMLFTGLFDLLKIIFQPIFIVISMIFYFIFKLSHLIFMLLVALLEIGKLFYALVKGLLNTITGFVFTPSTPDHGSWTPIFQNVFDGLNYYQLDKVAYILMFLVWIITAVVAIRTISAPKGGGE